MFRIKEVLNKGKFIGSITLCLILSIFTLAQSPVSEPRSGRKQEAAMILLERSECYGTCPSYKVKIFGNGKLIYEGVRYVKIKGKISTEVTTKQFQELMAEIIKAGYFSLRNSYADGKDGCTAMSSDDSWAFISIQINKRKKSVKHYLGCLGGNNKFDRELQRLSELEKRIDEIVKIEHWVGTVEERRKFEYLKRPNP